MISTVFPGFFFFWNVIVFTLPCWPDFNLF